MHFLSGYKATVICFSVLLANSKCESEDVPKEVSIDDLVILKSNRSTVVGRKLYTVLENRPYVAFWKVPYAEPPLNHLRFKVSIRRLLNLYFTWKNTIEVVDNEKWVIIALGHALIANERRFRRTRTKFIFKSSVRKRKEICLIWSRDWAII